MALNIIPIEAADGEPRLEAYQNIRERDLVGRQNRFIAEGRTVLAALLRAKRFQAESLLVSARKLPNLMPLLEDLQPQCPIYLAPPAVLDKIAGFAVHRGILAVGRRAAPPDFAEFLDNLPKSALLVGLNAISNHDNMGSVFRNAAAFAADGVILDAQCCDPLYRKAIRVSSGAALTVPYARGGAIADIMAALRSCGFTVLALSGQGAADIAERAACYHRASAKDGRGRLALLFGSEGYGLPSSVLAAAGGVRIPIAPDFDSLNIATACGIALSHFADKSKLR